SSLSTSSVSTLAATAIVFSVAVALRPGLLTEVAVTVPVLTLSLLAPAGIATFAQMSSVPPPGTVGVVVSGVVQLAWKNVVVHARRHLLLERVGNDHGEVHRNRRARGDRQT